MKLRDATYMAKTFGRRIYKGTPGTSYYRAPDGRYVPFSRNEVPFIGPVRSIGGWIRGIFRSRPPTTSAFPTIPGGTCPQCGARFGSQWERNLHYYRRHANRRSY